MPAKSPVVSSMYQIKPRLTNAERRAAEVAGAAGRQAVLKREAAERRAARVVREAEKPARSRG